MTSSYAARHGYAAFARENVAILYHELLQTHGDGHDGLGTFHAVKPSSPGGFLSALVPNRTDIPIIGAFLDPGTRAGDLDGVVPA